LSTLLCLGRHTVTGLLSTCGLQFQDWSAAYRLFSHQRVDPDALFDTVRRNAVVLAPPGPLCIAVDDTLIKKSGTHIPGVAYRRDPLGPRFQTNLIRAQRFVQFSLAIPELAEPNRVRMVPIDLHHAPTAVKPGRNATAEQLDVYAAERKRTNLVVQATHRLKRMLPLAEHRAILLLADGGFTNGTLFHNLASDVDVIGRIRKDAQLYYLPPPPSQPHRGRKLRYGPLAPTPEQLRQDDSQPWQSVRVFAAGRYHHFRVKTLEPLLWRPASYLRPVRVIVIAPLAYRPSRHSRVLYRQPAYLICTTSSLDLAAIVQRYVWRWEIEVNHRDEKTLLGMGQAQVRAPDSAGSVPAFIAACYAMLLLAGLRHARSHPAADSLPPPRWHQRPRPRRSTQTLINALRAELWGRALGLDHPGPAGPVHFSGFPNTVPVDASALKLPRSLQSAVLCAVA
jgi:DDE superfamily endonuclease